METKTGEATIWSGPRSENRNSSGRWAEIDAWAQTEGARQNTAFRGFELFAVVRFATDPRRQKHPRDRRFAVRDGVIRALQRRNAGMRSRGWRRRGEDAKRSWLEMHAGETWQGVRVDELLVALDAWLDAGSPSMCLRPLTPVTP